MAYRIITTAAFARAVRRYRHERGMLIALDAKLQRLTVAPHDVGGRLHGVLHGYRSTRLSRTFRLLFVVDDAAQTVTLCALDHRKDVYQ